MEYATGKWHSGSPSRLVPVPRENDSSVQRAVQTEKVLRCGKAKPHRPAGWAREQSNLDLGYRS
jgi:hypothetical protein